MEWLLGYHHICKNALMFACDYNNYEWGNSRVAHRRPYRELPGRETQEQDTPHRLLGGRSRLPDTNLQPSPLLQSHSLPRSVLSALCARPIPRIASTRFATQVLIEYQNEHYLFSLIVFIYLYTLLQAFAIPGPIFLCVLSPALYGAVPGYFLALTVSYEWWSAPVWAPVSATF